MIKKSLLAMMCIAVLVACGMFKHQPAAEPTPVPEPAPKTEVLPNQEDVDRVQSKFPGYTLDEFNRGKNLTEVNCVMCHSLKEPDTESESEWRKIVPEMVRKANKKNGNLIDAKGEEEILRYHITMSTAPRK